MPLHCPSEKCVKCGCERTTQRGEAEGPNMAVTIYQCDDCKHVVTLTRHAGENIQFFKD